MKEQAIQKINKTGKICGIITNICKVLVILGLVVSILGMVFCLIIPEELLTIRLSNRMEAVFDYDYADIIGISLDEEEHQRIQEWQEKMETGTLFINSPVNHLNPQLEMEYEASYSKLENIELTDSILNLDMVSKEVKFTSRTLGGLLFCVVISLGMVLVTLIFIGSLCKALQSCSSPFEEGVIKKLQSFAIALIPWTIVSTITNSILDSAKSGSASVSITLDLGVVLIVLVVLVLVYIFKYGAVLQQESDETL